MLSLEEIKDILAINEAHENNCSAFRSVFYEEKYLTILHEELDKYSLSSIKKHLILFVMEEQNFYWSKKKIFASLFYNSKNKMFFTCGFELNSNKIENFEIKIHQHLIQMFNSTNLDKETIRKAYQFSKTEEIDTYLEKIVNYFNEPLRD